MCGNNTTKNHHPAKVMVCKIRKNKVELLNDYLFGKSIRALLQQDVV